MDVPDRLMLTLLSMSVSSRGRYTPDGRQYVRVEIDERQRVEWEILPGEIDELEARGWVELLPPGPDAADDQAEVRLTERADYWLRRWLKGNRKRLPGLLAAFAPGRRPELAIQVLPVGAA